MLKIALNALKFLKIGQSINSDLANALKLAEICEILVTNSVKNVQIELKVQLARPNNRKEAK